MNLHERPRRMEPSNSSGRLEKSKDDFHEGWPPKSFSPDEVSKRRDAWEAESGQIIEELNWETDSSITEIYTRANQRTEQLGDQYTYERHQIIMEDETDRYVMEHPEEAEEYHNKWERWAKVAGVDPNISDAEWRQLALVQPSVTYMGQYRNISRALKRQQ